MTWYLLPLLLAQTPETAAEPAPPPTPFAETVYQALTTAAPSWTKERAKELRPLLKAGAGITVLDIEVGADGAILAERLVISSRNTIDDVARRFILDVEPLPEPHPDALGDNRYVTCIVRIELGLARRKPTLSSAVACQAGDSPVFQVAGLTGQVNTAKDPGARLLLGWAKEAYGDIKAATKLYREAINGAPAWDLAARALGLALVKGKKVPQGIPYLNTYVEARKGAADAYAFAREIDRYKKLQEARIKEMNRVRERLSKSDIAFGIKKGYALLAPCLRKARKARKLAVGVDTLVLTWKVRKDGSAHTPRLEAPESLVMTDHAECIERTITTWRFPRFSAGSEITASRVPIKVRGSRRTPKPSAKPSTAEVHEPIDEPTFSQCERSPGEIQGHIRGRYSRIQACIMSERRRAPTAPMPENLPITFVIDSGGPVRNIAVDHRAYRTGALAACVSRALKGSLLPSKGADCPAEFGIDLRRLAPRRR